MTQTSRRPPNSPTPLISTNPMIPFCPSCNEPLVHTDIARCPVCAQERPSRFGWPRDSLITRSVDQGRWNVIRRIGSGGFAVVYKVLDRTTGEARAMKVLNTRFSQSRDVQRRFWAEIETFRKLKHPNIVRFYRAGLLDSARPFMIMDLIRGLSLRHLVLPSRDVTPQPLQPKRASQITHQILQGLQAAHAHNLIHRDLNPNNVLVTTDTLGRDYARIIDYGVAKLLGKNTVDRITHHIVGTPEFMAPEQFSPGEELSFALDVWQAGALLFFLLTGRSPYPPPQNPADLIRVRSLMEERQHLPGPSPHDINPDLHEHEQLNTLTASMLSTDPARRPNTHSALTQLNALFPPQPSPSLRSTHLELRSVPPSPTPHTFCERCQSTTTPTSDACALCNTPRPKRGWPLDPILHTIVHQRSLTLKKRLRTTQKAVVYEAHTPHKQTQTALKIYRRPPKHLSALHQQLHTARTTLQNLHHPNILPIQDIGILAETQTLFTTTPLPSTRTIFHHTWPSHTQIPHLTDPIDVLRIGLQISSALETLHSQNIVHLHLTPLHITLLTTPQQGLHPQICDIEEALFTNPQDSQETLDLQQLLPFYPPEYFSSSTPLPSPTHDIFQLGACLHFLLTGWPPYTPPSATHPQQNTTFTALTHEHRAALKEHTGPSPNRYNPALRIWCGLSDLVALLLHPNPAQRPQTAQNTTTLLATTLQKCMHTLNPTPAYIDPLSFASEAFSGDFDFSFSHDDPDA